MSRHGSTHQLLGVMLLLLLRPIQICVLLPVRPRGPSTSPAWAALSGSHSQPPAPLQASTAAEKVAVAVDRL